MVHYVYEITNNINGMTYTGMTSKPSLETPYYGSSFELKADIADIGIEN